MLGETVTVLMRTKSGEDEMGEDVYTWSATEVANCLVRPTSNAELGEADTAQRPDGVEARYVIAFPKTYAGGNLTHARVVLSDRTGAVTDADKAAKTALRVSGAPDITQPCPTKWNMLVIVGVVNG